MVCTESGCMAVEAKWTEPAYETVGDWLTRSSKGAKGKRNRQDVLSGWLSLLEPTRTLTIDDVKGITYQTVHRAASACRIGTPPQFSYLQFVSDGVVSMHQKRLADLHTLRAVLGNPKSFPFRLIEVDIEPTAEFGQLAQLPKDRDTASKVKEALVARSLFHFRGMQIHDVP